MNTCFPITQGVRRDFFVLEHPGLEEVSKEQKPIRSSAGKSYVDDLFFCPGAEDFPYDKIPPIPTPSAPWKRHLLEVSPLMAMRFNRQETMSVQRPPS